MAVTGVLAQAHVGNQHQLFSRRRLFQRAQPLLHNAVLIPCAGTLHVLGRRQPEEQQSAHSQPRGFLGLAHRLVDREVEDAGHGANRMAHTLARAQKQGVNQVAGLQ